MSAQLATMATRKMTHQGCGRSRRWRPSSGRFAGVPPLGALVTGPILAQRCGCGNYVSRLARQAERLDHVAIFVLIAGTYTPVCLVTLRGGWGWSVFGVVWGLALLGLLLKLFFRHLPRWPSTALYVGMGWIAVVAVVPLVQSLPVSGLMWLVAGGVLYTLGAVIYAVKWPDPAPRVFGFHEVFHVFVLAGSITHFVFMMRYVLPGA